MSNSLGFCVCVCERSLRTPSIAEDCEYANFIDAKRVPGIHYAIRVTFFPTSRTSQKRCHQISEASLVAREAKRLAPVKINLDLKKQL